VQGEGSRRSLARGSQGWHGPLLRHYHRRRSACDALYRRWAGAALGAGEMWAYDHPSSDQRMKREKHITTGNWSFAECIWLRRVPNLGQSVKNSAKGSTRQRPYLPRANVALGKSCHRSRRPPTVTLCRVPAVRHSANIFFIFFIFLCRVPTCPGTRQPLSVECPPRRSAKYFFCFFDPFFCEALLQYLKPVLKFGIFFRCFAIFFKFISFSWIFLDNPNLNCSCMQ
jgi:hypothetical protein